MIVCTPSGSFWSGIGTSKAKIGSSVLELLAWANATRIILAPYRLETRMYATIELLRAEVRAWRKNRNAIILGHAGVWYIDMFDTHGVAPILVEVSNAINATDAANALEGE